MALSPDRERPPDLVQRHPIAFVWAGMLVYATGPLMIAASDTAGSTFSLLRMVLGIAVLGIPALIWRRAPEPSLMPRARLRLPTSIWVALAGVSFGLHQLSLALAIKATSVADVAVMNAVSPIVVALLAIPVLAEYPTRRMIAWTPVAIAGSATVAVTAATGAGGDAEGMVLAFANVIFFSLFLLCSKQATFRVAVWPFLWATVCTATVVVILAHLLLRIPVETPSSSDVLLAALMAVGPGALGHFLMTAPLRWVPVSLPPLVRLLQPFVSGGLALLLLGQAFTWAHGISATVTAVGVLGAVGRPRPPPPRH